MKDIKKDLDKGRSIDPTYLNLFKNTLKGLTSPNYLQSYMEKFIHSIISEDQSFMNKNSLLLLNSEPGRLLRQSFWEQATILSFWDLFYHLPSLRTLTADYQALPGTEFEKKFILHVRQWAIKQAFKQMHYQPESRALIPYTSKPELVIDELKNPTFSLLNIKQAENMAYLIDTYLFYLSYNKLDNQKNPIHHLINLGCFTSWPDLLHQILPLEDMFPYEIKECLKNERFNWLEFTVSNLYDGIQDYKQKKLLEAQTIQSFLKEQTAYYAEVFAKAEERDTQSVYTALTFLVEGYTQLCFSYPQAKFTISQNWDGARMLYEKSLNHFKQVKRPVFYRTAKKTLDKIMEPVFRKALIIYK